MADMAEDKIESIVDQIAEEMQEDHTHEGQDETQEIVEDLAHEMEEAEAHDSEDEAAEVEAEVETEVETEDKSLSSEGTQEVNDVDHLRMLEAILFASAAPISPQAMLERLPEGADLNILLPQLQQIYNGRGVELVEIGGQWALRTANDVGEALTVEKEVTKKMSKAALETMSIIAYHQPVTRGEIENIRGVATHRGTLDILMEMSWIKPGRRRETPGRPLTWMTTTDFLDHFQLESLMDLPGLDDLKASGLLDRRAAIDTIPDTGDLFDDGDVDPEEVLDKELVDQSDDDAYDEQTYKEIKAQNERNAAVDNNDSATEFSEKAGEEE